MSDDGLSEGNRQQSLNRRQLFRLVGTSTGAVLLTRVMSACHPPTGAPPNGPVGGINKSELKMDSLHVLPSNVVVGLDSGGIFAMSAICTHQGCVLEDSAGTVASGLYCPCHGSSFDGNGAVTHGPARAPLQHYQVTVAADGSITIDGSKPVGADVRVPMS